MMSLKMLRPNSPRKFAPEVVLVLSDIEVLYHVGIQAVFADQDEPFAHMQD